MKFGGRLPLALVSLFLCPIMLSGCETVRELFNGKGPVDEARAQGKKPSDFPEIQADIFKPMDGGIELGPDEIKGRNTWILWTAGNEAFWDYFASHSFGTVDLLKVLDSRRRPTRFKSLGLVNEPGTRAAATPDEYGLWLDQRIEPDGVDAKIYGKSSGIVGLRLFPNPRFDEGAKKRWDPERYYNDRNYYYDTKLVRPYRVGMSCGFCHVSFNPLNPPSDPENAQWENLSSNIGNQYLRVRGVFGHELKPTNFVWQLLNSQPAGVVDTSFIATDNVNNPRTINAIFNIAARLSVATEEKLSGGALKLPGAAEKMKVPHILKDGADSVGVLGALSRVYVSIGEYHQYWTTLFRPLIGLRAQSAFEVERARRNSVYWQATAERVENVAKFFLRAAGPMYLHNAPGGSRYLTRDRDILNHGKIVFAENCAGCHSSKRPPAGIAGDREKSKQWFREAVTREDFLDDNFLSDDRRRRVTEIGTNACSALATNAARGHVWDNFSSETYKTLPSVGEIEVSNPMDGTTWKFRMPAGGPGYYRPPSLVGLWATAPFLHNNSVGTYTGDPSVDGRMNAFNDAAERLLWPEKRLRANSIHRTTTESYLEIYGQFLPDFLKPLANGGAVRIGPIPAGTPINLLANLDVNVSISEKEKIAALVKLLGKIQNELIRIRLKKLDARASGELLKGLVPDLLKASTCPDFIVDRGHLFGADLPDKDKKALIEYLKTL
jgi:hypothetical protein